MLIKLYARGATPHLHIIENVTNVSVDSRQTTKQVFLMGEASYLTSYEHLDLENEDCRLISCEVDGEGKSILVFNKAYICTDEGRTIEPVIVDRNHAKSEFKEPEKLDA